MTKQGLHVMNTRTHKVERFEPVEPGHVRMYVCGPSVYDESHLGHARSYVGYDAIKRYFLVKGHRVTHVQNFTDVEENIAKRAGERGLTPLDWANQLIDSFLRDMDALHVLRATHYPRVSEQIPEVIEAVSKLLKEDVAYAFDCGPREHLHEGGCDVYFDAQSIDDCGQLIGTNIDELTVDRPMRQGDRRHPLDFALWKSRDDWGVLWDAPWGRGRPGWHIECTVMAQKYLGTDFDIHGGGLDLVFPHHENERAIGEALTGKRYCNHYLHNGFVTVGNTKMSKSLGNFVTIRQLLERHEAEVLRTFLLSSHYRAPLNYDEGAIGAAERRVHAWRDGIARLQKAAGDASAAPTEQVDAVARAFWAALEDDFHFDRALDAVDKAFTGPTPAAPEAAALLAFLGEAARTLGILWMLDES